MPIETLRINRPHMYKGKTADLRNNLSTCVKLQQVDTFENEVIGS